jgi:hypothetical protein
MFTTFAELPWKRPPALTEWPYLFGVMRPRPQGRGCRGVEIGAALSGRLESRPDLISSPRYTVYICLRLTSP